MKREHNEIYIKGKPDLIQEIIDKCIVDKRLEILDVKPKYSWKED